MVVLAVQLAYSSCNRSASIRIPDLTANPYLAYSAMLMAGVGGIRNKIHPGDVAIEDCLRMFLVQADCGCRLSLQRVTSPT